MQSFKFLQKNRNVNWLYNLNSLLFPAPDSRFGTYRFSFVWSEFDVFTYDYRVEVWIGDIFDFYTEYQRNKKVQQMLKYHYH